LTKLYITNAGSKGRQGLFCRKDLKYNCMQISVDHFTYIYY